MKTRLVESWVVKPLCLAVVALGLFLFWFMAAADLSDGRLLVDSNVSSSVFFFITGLHIKGYYPFSKEGPVGFAGFCLACAGFAALRSKGGVKISIAETFLYFAAPTLLIFEFGIWLSLPSTLDVHVTSFATWAVGQRFLLSNANVLVLSLCLTMAGVGWAAYRRSSRGWMVGISISSIVCVVTLYIVAVLLVAGLTGHPPPAQTYPTPPHIFPHFVGVDLR